MTSFGLLMYGPAQHYWYGALDRQFPQKASTTGLPGKGERLICTAEVSAHNKALADMHIFRLCIDCLPHSR